MQEVNELHFKILTLHSLRPLYVLVCREIKIDLFIYYLYYINDIIWNCMKDILNCAANRWHCRFKSRSNAEIERKNPIECCVNVYQGNLFLVRGKAFRGNVGISPPPPLQYLNLLAGSGRGRYKWFVMVNNHFYPPYRTIIPHSSHLWKTTLDKKK
jgi:hypothetical protein